MMEQSYYIVIPAKVRSDERLSPQAVLVYGDISSLCCKEGYCWAQNSYFAELSGVSERQVQRLLQQLKDAGHIFIVFDSEGNRRIYLDEEDIDPAYSEGGDKNVVGVRHFCPERHDKNVTQNNIYNNKYNTTPTSLANGYNIVADKDLKMTARCFESQIGPLNQTASADLIHCLDVGYSPHLICFAIEKASNEKKGWSYAKGILNAYGKKGIFHTEEAKADDAAYQTGRGQAPYTPPPPDAEALENMRLLKKQFKLKGCEPDGTDAPQP